MAVSRRIRDVALLVMLSASTQLMPSSLVRAQGAELAGSATAAVAVDSLFKEIDRKLEQARELGDYLTVVALVRAKDALDAWKNTNTELMDKAFTSLDAASKENFGSLRSLVADVNDSAKDRLATASALSDSANQLVDRLPGGRPYISRFQPRVVPPTATSSYAVRVNGVSLDEANPQMMLQGTPAKRTVIGPNEVLFEVPLSATPRDPAKLKVHTLTVTYDQPKRGFLAWLTGAKEQVTRQLPLLAIPETLASYSIEGERKYDKRVDVPRFTQNMGQFKARNKRVYRTALPDNNWRWNIDDKRQFSWLADPNSGNKGRCEGIDWSQSSENGIRVFAHLDQIGPNRQYPTAADGRVNCQLAGPIYRFVPTTEPFTLANGELNWREDKLVQLPKDVGSFQLSVTTFDGRKRVLSSTDTDKLFELRRSGSMLTLTPRVPSDLVAVQ